MGYDHQHLRVHFWSHLTDCRRQHPLVRCRAILVSIIVIRHTTLSLTSDSAGLGVGLLSATIPLYQSETAPKWIRGTIVGCYQWAITIGLLIAAIVLNSTKDRNDTGSYRIPIGVQFLFSIIIVGGMLVLPETPRYLIKRGKYDQAAKALSKIRRLDVNSEHLQDELAEIRANHEFEMNLGSSSYMALLKAPLGKRLATGVLLQGLQQLT